MNRFAPFVVVVALSSSWVLATDAFAAACRPGDTKKTTICHVPEGNPQNPQTQCVDNSAVSKHIGQHPGDQLGPCPPAPVPSPTVVSPPA